MIRVPRVGFAAFRNRRGPVHVLSIVRLAVCWSGRTKDIQLFSSCRHTFKYEEVEVRAGQRGHLRDSLGVKCDL